jgi:hypothetical protein
MLGYSPLQAGAAALPFASTTGITSPIVGGPLQKARQREGPVATGLSLMAAGLAVMTNSTAGSDMGHDIFAAISARPRRLLIPGGA